MGFLSRDLVTWMIWAYDLGNLRRKGLGPLYGNGDRKYGLKNVTNVNVPPFEDLEIRIE